MTTTTDRPTRRQSGPPMALLATISLLLLIAGIAGSAAVGGVFPSPFGEASTIEHYFMTQSGSWPVVSSPSPRRFRWRSTQPLPVPGSARWESPPRGPPSPWPVG